MNAVGEGAYDYLAKPIEPTELKRMVSEAIERRKLAQSGEARAARAVAPPVAQIVGTTPAGLTFRGLPDVAYDAALETGALLWQAGVEYISAGTSLASPMAAGVYARAQSAHGNALGFAPIQLYHVYAASTPQQIAGPPETELIGPFHDILQGTNGAYTALPKYDYTTGLGSLDIARFNAAVGH